MKKIFLLIFALSIATGGGLSAQSSKDKGPYLGFVTGTGGFKKEFQAVNMKATAGYAFGNRLFGGIEFNGSYGLFKRDGVKTYDTAFIPGVMIGYDFLKFKRSDDTLDARVSAGWSVTGSDDWGVNVYDAGVYYNFGHKTGMQIFYGIGCRYYDSRNSFAKSYFTFYIDLGFTFGL